MKYNKSVDCIYHIRVWLWLFVDNEINCLVVMSRNLGVLEKLK